MAVNEDNLLTNDEETWGNIIVVLQKDDENITYGACEQLGHFKKNGNK